jgi:hypothetical protein
VVFRAIGVVALATSAWSTVILGVYLRKPGQADWPAWRLLALSTVGGIVAGAGLLLLA